MYQSDTKSNSIETVGRTARQWCFVRVSRHLESSLARPAPEAPESENGLLMNTEAVRAYGGCAGRAERGAACQM